LKYYQKVVVAFIEKEMIMPDSGAKQNFFQLMQKIHDKGEKSNLKNHMKL
jgi:hypothetical protein